jgi:DNA repair protein RecO (recombination protein O)
LRGSDLLSLSQDAMPDAAGLSALRSMMREVIRFHLGGAELRAWHVLAAALSRR